MQEIDWQQHIKDNPDLAKRNPELVPPEPKPSKYHNIRTEYKGRVYASKKEARYAETLDQYKAAGVVLAWFAQVPFPLPGGITYVADFVVICADWSVSVRDAKGMKTDVYRLKKKLFKERYGKEIEEV